LSFAAHFVALGVNCDRLNRILKEPKSQPCLTNPKPTLKEEEGLSETEPESPKLLVKKAPQPLLVLRIVKTGKRRKGLLANQESAFLCLLSWSDRPALAPLLMLFYEALLALDSLKSTMECESTSAWPPSLRAMSSRPAVAKKSHSLVTRMRRIACMPPMCA